MFDIAVIGAGINGCSAAYFLHQSGLSVVLIDKEGIAAGGSGAAGAFISPKFSKSGPLKEVVEEAYSFSLGFYNANFPEHIINAPLLHIAKHDDEDAKVAAFKASTTLDIGEPPPETLALLHDEPKAHESVYLQQSAVVDAAAMCEALCRDVAYLNEEIDDLLYEDGCWSVGSVKARRVVLATGAYRKLIDEEYIKLRPVWGHRIDAKIGVQMDAIVHHLLSISVTKPDGTVGIGATHDVHFHPDAGEEYDLETGRKELLEKTRATLKLDAIDVVRDYTGLRSGTNDYMPIIGPLVDTEASLAAFPELLQGVKTTKHLTYHPEVYMINGSGGYGYVLAPYLAQKLCEHIVNDAPFDASLLPERFFYRSVKRRG